MPKIDGEFQLAEWRVQPSLLRFRRGGKTLTVGEKVMGVLQCLAERPGELVGKDELVARAWGGDAASDEALTAVVYELRRALGDDARRPRFIGTIRGRGYRLLISPSPVDGGGGVLEDRRGDFDELPSPQPSPPGGRGESIRSAEMAEIRSSSEETVKGNAWLVPARARSVRMRRARVGALAALLLVAAGLLWTVTFRDRQGDATKDAGPLANLLSQGPAGDEIRSVAVLALESRGTASSEESSFFARGLSEQLAIELARGGWLDVVPAFSRTFAETRRSEMRRSETDRAVDAVVEGAVRRQGDRLLVTVQLIAADGQLLWGGSWERAAGDSTSLELELATQISRRLRGRLGANTRLARSPEVDEALRLGRHFLDAGSPQEARRFFSFAVEHQPTLASARVGLADALLEEAREQPPEERRVAVEQARRAARTALEIDADLPSAHASLGTIALLHEGDLGGARRHFANAGLDAGPAGGVDRVEPGSIDFHGVGFEDAVFEGVSFEGVGFEGVGLKGTVVDGSVLNGGSFERSAPASSLRGYAAFLSAVGRHDEAIGQLRQALVQAPASVDTRLDLARAFYLAGRFDEALAELLVLDRLAPLEARSARLRSEILLIQGEHRLAVEACRQAVELSGGPEELAELIGQVYDTVGLEGVVRCLRDFSRQDSSRDLPAGGLFEPLHLARLEAIGGDAGAALELIRLAEAQASPELVWLAVDPAFRALRGVEAFEALAASRRLPA